MGSHQIPIAIGIGEVVVVVRTETMTCGKYIYIFPSLYHILQCRPIEASINTLHSTLSVLFQVITFRVVEQQIALSKKKILCPRAGIVSKIVAYERLIIYDIKDKKKLNLTYAFMI